jgi:hypothetical protein
LILTSGANVEDQFLPLLESHFAASKLESAQNFTSLPTFVLSDFHSNVQQTIEKLSSCLET